MVMQTLCEDDRVNAEFAHNSSVCFQEASSMMFVYSIAWFLMFWSYGFPLLKSLSNDHIKNKERAIEVVVVPAQQSVPITNRWDKNVIDYVHRIGGTFSLEWMKSVLLSPSMVAIFIGLFIGLVPALQQGLFNPRGGDLFHGTFRPLGSAIVTLGEPLICVNCLVMAASLAQTDLGITSGIRYAQSMIDSFLFKDVETAQQNQWAKLIRIESQIPTTDTLPCIVIQQSQDEDSAPIAMKSDEENRPRSVVPKLRTIATHLLCRLITSTILKPKYAMLFYLFPRSLRYVCT